MVGNTISYVFIEGWVVSTLPDTHMGGRQQSGWVVIPSVPI